MATNVDAAAPQTRSLLAIALLHHLLQSICNAHAITGLVEDTRSGTATSTLHQTRLATAIYARVSMLNHSCEPNVMSSWRRDGRTIVLRASRSIAANNEVLNCYGPHYRKMDVATRQQSLIDQYRFTCRCEACVREMKTNDANRKWPLRCIKGTF